MSDGMERVMREIHVMFAKAEKLSSREDMIIVDKKKVFALLEELNHEVYDAMDRYEESKVSRELAAKKLKEETDAMVERASDSAEEIYAASILYSDTTLTELEKEVEHAREDLKNTWEGIDKQISDKLHSLETNRRELKSQLEQMEQKRLYLDLIGRAKEEEVKEQEEQKSLNRVKRTESTKEHKEIEIQEKKKQNTKEPAKPESSDKLDLLDEWDAFDDLGDFETGGLTEEQKKIEIYVSDSYRTGNVSGKRASSGKAPDTLLPAGELSAEDFDLDAEYFAWKEEINGAPPTPYTANEKKGLRNIFKRIK